MSQCKPSSRPLSMFLLIKRFFKCPIRQCAFIVVIFWIPIIYRILVG